MKPVEITAALLSEGEAAEEASLFRVLLPSLLGGCVFCAHKRGENRCPGTAYLRLGWTDGGPEIRAPPAYAPVCDACLEL